MSNGFFHYEVNMNYTVQKIQLLLEENNEKPAPLMKKLGLSSSSFSDWKREKACPSTEAIIKIAKYFDVSTDSLLIEDIDNKEERKYLTEQEKEILQIYSLLDETDKRECLGFMKGILRKELQAKEKANI